MGRHTHSDPHATCVHVQTAAWGQVTKIPNHLILTVVVLQGKTRGTGHLQSLSMKLGLSL